MDCFQAQSQGAQPLASRHLTSPLLWWIGDCEYVPGDCSAHGQTITQFQILPRPSPHGALVTIASKHPWLPATSYLLPRKSCTSTGLGSNLGYEPAYDDTMDSRIVYAVLPLTMTPFPDMGLPCMNRFMSIYKKVREWSSVFCKWHRIAENRHEECSSQGCVKLRHGSSTFCSEY